jgi:hypothetical protein
MHRVANLGGPAGSTEFLWTHYRTLLRVDKRQARAFYEIEALRNNWSARELDFRALGNG